MKTSFFPVGTSWRIGAVTVILVGRLVAWARTALACASAGSALLVAAADACEPLELLLLSLEPHPATATSAAATATAPAPRRYLLHAGVGKDMCTLLVGTVRGSVDPVCLVLVGRRGDQPAVRGRNRAQPRLAPVVAPLARRWMPVTASAAMSTTPTNMFAAHCGALARPRPVVPVPSSRTAIIVPHELKRPCLSCVAPRNAAAKPGST